MGLLEEPTNVRRIRLRWAGTCSVCGAALAPGTEAVWDKTAKQATCLACGGHAVQLDVPINEAGASAHAKAHELEARAIRDARRRWGAEAAAVAAKVVHDDPSVRAWDKGGDGESHLAGYIDRELGDAAIGLHDRHIPGTRAANIDHIFIAPSGIWVVDAKAYTGKLERRDAGPIWDPQPQVFVGNRNRTKLADGFVVQLRAVRAAVEHDPLYERLQIHPALCFIGTEWGLFAKPFEIRGGIAVLYERSLRDRLRKPGGLTREDMLRLASQLVPALPAATAQPRR